MTTATQPSCPKCGGNMWDNRETKRSPKAPDFKCRDRTCDGVIWPPKPGQGNGNGNNNGGGNGKHAVSMGGPLPGEEPTAARPGFPALVEQYRECLKEAVTCAQYLNGKDIGTDSQTVAAMAATLFIQRNQRGC